VQEVPGSNPGGPTKIPQFFNQIAVIQMNGLPLLLFS
jgi:hypothetical protein